jgi:hypothetical protein
MARSVSTLRCEQMHATGDCFREADTAGVIAWLPGVVTIRCYLTVVLRSFIHCSRVREGGSSGPAARCAFQQQKAMLSNVLPPRRNTC